MSNPHNTYPAIGLNDYVMTCQICGIPWPASQMTRLGKFTGNDGKYVCPRDRDKELGGLKPYKIRPERPLTRVSANDLVSDALPESRYPGIDPTIQNPWIYSPQQLLELSYTWGTMAVKWEDLDITWGGAI